MTSGENIKMGTKLVVTKDNKTYKVEPTIEGSMGNFQYVPAEIKDLNMKITIRKVDPNTQKADFAVTKIVEDNKQAAPKEVLSIQASVKPFISLVWVGILIMVFGFFVSVARRLKESLI